LRQYKIKKFFEQEKFLWRLGKKVRQLWFREQTTPTITVIGKKVIFGLIISASIISIV
jgi:hypothetical protein